MASNAPIKLFAFGGGLYLGYEILSTIYWNNKINRYKNRIQNNQGVLGEREGQERDAIVKYEQNHFGKQLVNRMNAQSVLEEQVQNQLNQKLALREQLKKTDSSLLDQKQLNKLDDDIKKLEHAISQFAEDSKKDIKFNYPKREA